MNKRIITINRMYGSNGRIIGKALANEMGIGFYDRELIEMASNKKNVPLDQFAEVDERRPSPWGFPIDNELQIGVDRYPIPMNDVLFGIQREIILSLSDREDCVIVGRCANHILTGDDTLHIFIYAPFETRVKTIMERLDREEKSARKLVKGWIKNVVLIMNSLPIRNGWIWDSTICVSTAVNSARMQLYRLSRRPLRRNSKVGERTFPHLFYLEIYSFRNS